MKKFIGENTLSKYARGLTGGLYILQCAIIPYPCYILFFFQFSKKRKRKKKVKKKRH